MKTKISIGVLLLLVAIGTVQATEIDPGESYTGNCTQDCVNGTYDVTCTNYTNESCGVCEINRVLSWNETYINTDGNCDLDITCEDFNWSRMGLVTFPMEINVEKDDNGTLNVIIDIFDRNGEKLRTWEDYMKSEDIVEQKIKHEFSCPAELSTDINMATCAPYLMRVLNSSDPMMLQMVTGQTIATQELVTCMSELKAEKEEKNKQEIRFNNCDSNKDVLESELEECKYDLEDPRGLRMTDIEDAKKEYGGYASAWCIAFFLVLTGFGSWFSWVWYNSNRFEGG